MCQKYDALVKESVTQRGVVFPCSDIKKSFIPKLKPSRRFDYWLVKNRVWRYTVHSPTVHSLRHTCLL